MFERSLVKPECFAGEHCGLLFSLVPHKSFLGSALRCPGSKVEPVLIGMREAILFPCIFSSLRFAVQLALSYSFLWRYSNPINVITLAFRIPGRKQVRPSIVPFTGETAPFVFLVAFAMQSSQGIMLFNTNFAYNMQDFPGLAELIAMSLMIWKLRFL